MLFVNSLWIITFRTIQLGLVCLVNLGNAELTDLQQCSSSAARPLSDYVSAKRNWLLPGMSCDTRTTPKPEREVHLVVVKLPENYRKGKGRPKVRLTALTRHDGNQRDVQGPLYRLPDKPIIVVLQADVPVRWMVNVQRFPKIDGKHLFVISDGSSIKFRTRKAKIMCTAQPKSISFRMDSSKMLTWVVDQYGSITSFNEISSVNIKLFIGRDENSPNSQCSVDKLSTSGRIFSAFEEKKEVKGCVIMDMSTVLATPAFVIEMLEAPANLTAVTLDLLPPIIPPAAREGLSNGNSKPREHNEEYKRGGFSIVIRSPRNIIWTLKSPMKDRWVDIVSNVEVMYKINEDVGIRMEEDLNKISGQGLLTWARDFVSPVQMYAGIKDANKIEVRIPERRADESNRLGAGVTENTKELSKNIKTQCTKDYIEVKIAKEFIKALGGTKSGVSFYNENCSITEETKDFVMLRTRLQECGTKLLNQETGLHSNVVKIKHDSDALNQLLSAELGSGYMAEVGSGSLGDDEDYALKAKDYQQSTFNVIVYCNASKAPSEVQIPRKGGPYTHDAGKVHCAMDLYRSSFFQNPSTKFPVIVTKDTTLFVKASLTHGDKSLIVDRCWLSTSSLPHSTSAFTKDIINHGCKRGSSLTWLSPLYASQGEEVKRAKFSFKLDHDFKGKSAIYLHCHFYGCSRAESRSCTVDPGTHCKTRSSYLSQSSVACGPLSLGPIDMTDEEVHVQPAKGMDLNGNGKAKDQGSSASTGGQQQRIIIKGLDSPTVVGIAFASFIIGIILVAVLWFIHTHTGPAKNPSNRGSSRSEVNAGGDMTPNSSSPMTA